jgi:YfiH family protein
LRQVHGRSVVDVDAPDFVSGAAADAVVASATGRRTWAPAVRWADCVPLLLADPYGGAVAAVHAGWRGIVAGVVPAALRALGERGAGIPTVVAAVGPAVGSCCYEVGDDVAVEVARSAGVEARDLTIGRGSAVYLDLRRAVWSQLRLEGLSEGSIHIAPWCTACAAELFDSYRRLGAGAGRQMACIGWPA